MRPLRLRTLVDLADNKKDVGYEGESTSFHVIM